MAVVYPGLVNIDNSPITITTLNHYSETDANTVVVDLSSQIPIKNVTNPDTPKTIFTLAQPAKANTFMLILDGLTLSPYDSVSQLGDYRLNNSLEVELLFDGLQKADANDTAVLLARYTIA